MISSRPGKRASSVVARGDVQGRVLADHGMRAGAGLDRRDARRIDQAGAAQPLGVLLGHEVVGDDGKVDAARAAARGISRSISAVLPEPTGPPMPMRAAWRASACGAGASCRHASPQHVALRERQRPRRLAGGEHAVDEDVEGLRVDADVRAGVVPAACRASSACACRAPAAVLSRGRAIAARSRFDRQRMHEAGRQRRRGAGRRRPIAGACRIGSQVISEAALSPIAPHAMKPPLITSSGLMPKKAGRHTTMSAILPSSSEPTWSCDAEGARGVDGVFGDVAPDARIVAEARGCSSGSAPRWSFILDASCQVRQITSWMRPMPWLSEPSIEMAPMSCSTSSAAMVCARMRLSANATSSGIAGLR